MTPRGPIKPPAPARPGRLLRTRGGFALGPRAEEEILGAARIFTEGRLDGGSFFGSTLFTIDLEQLGPRLRGPEAARERQRLLQAVSGSVRVHLRAMRLAYAEVVRRHPDRRLGTAIVETRFRLEGARLLIDVDFEVPVHAITRTAESLR